MSSKPQFQHDAARAVAEEIVARLKPSVDRIIIAGSLRRLKEMVGDIEILYVPKFGYRKSPGELFDRNVNLAEEKIRSLEESGLLMRRQNLNGADTFGTLNKLLRHVPSGIPVDLFRTDSRSWHNYLVCRTGPADLNIQIAQRAKELGWKWHPYDSGFSRGRELRILRSEEELFEFLDWEFLPPWERSKHVATPRKNGAGGVKTPAGQSNLVSRLGDDGHDRRLEERPTPVNQRNCPS